MTHSSLFALGLIVATLLGPAGALAQGLEKVRIVYASRGLPFLSPFVAKEKGFYLKQGLDAVEERARYELGMVRPDEVFFQIVEKQEK